MTTAEMIAARVRKAIAAEFAGDGREMRELVGARLDAITDAALTREGETPRPPSARTLEILRQLGNNQPPRGQMFTLDAKGISPGELAGACREVLALLAASPAERATEGAPSALVALVREWQETRREFSRVGTLEGPENERIANKNNQLVAAILAWPDEADPPERPAPGEGK